MRLLAPAGTITLLLLSGCAPGPVANDPPDAGGKDAGAQVDAGVDGGQKVCGHSSLIYCSNTSCDDPLTLGQVCTCVPEKTDCGPQNISGFCAFPGSSLIDCRVFDGTGALVGGDPSVCNSNEECRKVTDTSYRCAIQEC